MRSLPPRARALRSILACLTLGAGLCACAGPTLVVRPANDCSTLVPDGWRMSVPGADVPTMNTVGDWIAFGDAQTGQLDKANGRTADTITIVEKCEARDNAATKALQPKPWWKLW